LFQNCDRTEPTQLIWGHYFPVKFFQDALQATADIERRLRRQFLSQRGCSQFAKLFQVSSPLLAQSKPVTAEGDDKSLDLLRIDRRNR
jgi:hypothetical protein